MAVGSDATSQGTATVLLLDTPSHLLVGLDLAQWRVGKHFKGVTAIVPGCHFLHWVEASTPNRISAEAADTSQKEGEGPRESECTYTHMRVTEAIGGTQRGEFLFLPPHGVVVRRWAGPPLGRFLPLDEDEAVRFSIGVREGAFMRGLGRYPTHLAGQWKSLTHCITKACVKRVEPLGGCLEAEGMPLTAQEEKTIDDYYREARSKQTQERSSCSPSPPSESPSKDAGALSDDGFEKREENSLLQEEEEGPTEAEGRRQRRRERVEAASSRMFYSDVKSVRGLAVRQSRLAASHARRLGQDAEAAAAAAVTAHCSDRSEQLEELLKEVEEGGGGLLGELQMAFIALVLGHHYPSLLHWKELLQVAAASERAVYIHPEFFARLLECLYFQLQQAPEDLLLDPESVLRQSTSPSQNFLVQTCVSLLEVCLHVDRGAAEAAIHAKLKENKAKRQRPQKEEPALSGASKDATPEETEVSPEEVQRTLAKAEPVYKEIERQALPLLRLMQQIHNQKGDNETDLLMLLQGEDAPVVVELGDNEMI